LTFVNGCTNLSDEYNVTVVGVDEQAVERGLNLYPNPTSSSLNIELFLFSKTTVSFKILDISGRVVHYQENTLDIGLQKQEINVEVFAAGTYILEMNDGKSTMQRKFVKQ